MAGLADGGSDVRTDRQILGRIVSGHSDESDLPALTGSDWDRLATAAQLEGVAGGVYFALSNSRHFESIPKSAQGALRARYFETLLHNEGIFRELERLMPQFERAEIPVVVLKGACFALTIYPDIGLRQMDDLDLLVPASRLADAVAIAKSAGFEETLPEASPGLTALLSHHVFLEKSGTSPIALEIHDALVASEAFTFAVPVDWFWTQTEGLSGVSQKRFGSLRMLTPTAQVLYASAHAMLQHGGRLAPLRWFHDLDLLIRHYGSRIDWELLLSQAREFEWGSALEAALAETQAVFATPIPDHVRASLLNTTDRHRALVELRQVAPATHTLEERQKLMTLNWRGRIHLATALIAPCPAYMIWRYGLKSRWLVPVYYPVRWWGILRDGLKTLKVSLGRKATAPPPDRG